LLKISPLTAAVPCNLTLLAWIVPLKAPWTALLRHDLALDFGALAADCTALKNRGIKIAMLYATYLALPTNALYMTWINPFNPGPYGPSINSKIAKNMEACASPGFYFEVSPTDGIAQAMTALFPEGRAVGAADQIIFKASPAASRWRRR
jgi:hypothetical protein